MADDVNTLSVAAVLQYFVILVACQMLLITRKKTEWIMALQHHPRSLILAQNESAYATSYWSSKVTFVPSCPISEVLQVFC